MLSGILVPMTTNHINYTRLTEESTVFGLHVVQIFVQQVKRIRGRQIYQWLLAKILYSWPLSVKELASDCQWLGTKQGKPIAFISYS